MTKDEAKKLSDILKAYSEGKIIEVSNNGSQWAELNMSYPDVVFKYNQHRVKPEPKLVPFTFEDNKLFRDKWVRLKNNPSNLICRIISFDKCCLRLSNNYNKFEVDSYSYESLLKNFIFEDGNPCGKYINE